MTAPERKGRGRVLLPTLLGLATLCLLTGFVVPAFDVQQLGSGTSTYSVLTGILHLATSGSPLLAAIVFAFSVVFPVAKLVLMSLAYARMLGKAARLRTVRWLTFLGRWSMLDVFVVVILIGSVHLGILSSAQERVGIYLFGAGILLSMVAAGRVVAFLKTLGRQRGSWVVSLDPGDLWASIMAMIFFGAGVSLPLMDVEKWIFWKNEYSVASAVLVMLSDGPVALGFGILVFVVLLPAVRFFVLTWLRFVGTFTEEQVQRYLLVDDWAMMDVYVFALLIVATKITDVAGVQPRAGLYLLAASAALSLYDSWRLRSRLPV